MPEVRAPAGPGRLRESIATFGVRQPVVVDEAGTILDGHHRVAIAAELGISYPRRVVRGSLTVGMRLLADIHWVFDGEDHLPTAELLRRLHEIEGSPWRNWRGKPLTARGLARLLEPYREGGRAERSRGYFAADFRDAWRRFLPAGDTDFEVTAQ